ncbi:flagellar biosynthesis protein FlhB [Thiomicrorhabdus sp. 6S3-12]|uniref:flagellar biosynthesis protein FlhB n=1 Tax=Thiomicrorhabdus sp. 6S3-12 TaxID=2819681 RepID=UPI001AACE8BD|nr:flagellar biosynthesis protein FlhB [Thiomicrorhabdus sp. 6S3-12]MBO1924544.1 flagellar biosynthesis protein FlhB [Thiomicrorhabdus sp. 6S3-12]
MAENEDGTEKSEEPSEKKLREAREKGQIPRSKELTTLLMTLSAAVFLYLYGAQMMNDFETLLTRGLSFSRDVAFDQKKLADLIIAIMIEGILMILPFLLLMLFIAIVSPMLLGGWAFSTKAMAPSFSKLNPIKGIKRIFSAQALMELFKALAKFLLVISMATAFLYMIFSEVLGLGVEPKDFALAHSGKIIVEAFIFVSLSLLLVALIDVPFQLWNHNRQLKMTKQEVKEEFKQQEGNPEVKGRIRQVQREMSQRRMMQKVPEADVVITNPTHFAVALKYDPENMSEPVVVAIGSDFMAAQIRTIAQEHNIMVVEAQPLARALYYNAEVDQPIPYDLFKAVAAVLAYVFQLKEHGSAQDVDFQNLPIPENVRTE